MISVNATTDANEGQHVHEVMTIGSNNSRKQGQLEVRAKLSSREVWGLEWREGQHDRR